MLMLNKWGLEDWKIKTFSRDNEWFDYIFTNHNRKKDYLSEYNIIIGPIVNNTLYDTLEILTSGYIKKSCFESSSNR